MPDDNTQQTDDGAQVIEPTLSLGANPVPASASPATDDTTAATDSNVPPPIEPVEDTTPVTTEEAPVVETPTDTTPAADAPIPAEEPAAGPATSTDSSNDLDSIRSSALEELTPLVSELDQEPEEKYRTLMMIIQSSDNQELIKSAFDAAHSIEDKKAKAEALVNIINEINYFTGKEEKTEA